MAVVFLSYSSKDEEKAKSALTMLEGVGITCWFAQRDIPPGDNYALAIPRAIGECSYFVLLLSSASQESPYVKLELDQAIKRKKKIFPVLLEKLQETDDTNFFLNAKQSVDASVNFTDALNTVIDKIRSNPLQLGKIPEQRKECTVHQKHEPICCPHCGCTTLKRNNSFVTRYLYLENNKDLDEAIATGLLKHRNIFNKYICLGSLLSIVIMVAEFFKYLPDEISSSDVVLMMLPVFFLATLVFAHFELIGTPDLPKVLIQAIKNSKLRYWSFKCAQCEKSFSILIPKKDELKDWVESLLKNKDEN